MFVHIILRSVQVAEWPPFGKELLTRLTIGSLSILVISCFGFEGGIWVVIAPVLGRCILVTFSHTEEVLNRNVSPALNEPRHEKTNVLVSDLVPHKPGCTTA